jgi:hypothetical protein
VSEIPELPPVPDRTRPLPPGGLDAAVTEGARRRGQALRVLGGGGAAVVLVAVAVAVLPGGGKDTLGVTPRSAPFASSPSAQPVAPDPDRATDPDDGAEGGPVDATPDTGTAAPVAPEATGSETAAPAPPVSEPAPVPPPAETRAPEPPPEQTSREAFSFDGAFRSERPDAVVLRYGDSSSCPSEEVRREVREDGDTVVVTLTRTAIAPGTACTADYRAVYVEVSLSAALGERTVVDGSRGEPVPVSPGPPSCC